MDMTTVFLFGTVDITPEMTAGLAPQDRSMLVRMLADCQSKPTPRQALDMTGLTSAEFSASYRERHAHRSFEFERLLPEADKKSRARINGLPGNAAVLLRFIGAEGGRIAVSLHDLAARLDIDASKMPYAVTRLSRDGLISRQCAGRGVKPNVWVLTAKGRKFLATIDGDAA